MSALKSSGIRKLSPSMRVKLSSDADATVRVANSFGLPAGTSCPGRTPQCDSCYAESTQKRYPAVSRAMQHNADVLAAGGGSVAKLAALLRPVVRAAVESCDARGVPPTFRIHWDGDFYSRPYARAWRVIIEEFPAVAFWSYTRSFRAPVDVTDILADVDNLELYLSVDRYNYRAARTRLERFPRLHAAASADTAAETAELLEKVGRGRAPICPEVVGRIPLMVDAETGRGAAAPGREAMGACIACGLCPAGRADIRFPFNRSAE